MEREIQVLNTNKEVVYTFNTYADYVKYVRSNNFDEDYLTRIVRK